MAARPRTVLFPDDVDGPDDARMAEEKRIARAARDEALRRHAERERPTDDI